MRKLLAPIFAAALAAIASSGAAAEDWPTRPIRVIVPLSAGSAAPRVRASLGAHPEGQGGSAGGEQPATRADAAGRADLGEAGYPNSSYRFWLGVFAPAKTPPAIVDRLNAEIEKALQAPAVRAKLAQLGVQPMTMTPQEFVKFAKEELESNAELTKAAGIAAQ